VLASLLIASLPDAMAQVDLSGSVALQSEYRYRGQTPGNSGPVPQLTLNLDHTSGWYAGGFASGVAVANVNGYQLQAYGGYAQRLTSGYNWEAGCGRTAYTQVHFNDFNECYGGLSGERFSTRLSYSPRYMGYAARTLYGEASLFYPVHPRVNLTAHAGLLYNLSDGVWPGIPYTSRYDARVGVSIPLGDLTLQLAREHAQDDGRRYSFYPLHPSRAWTVSATYSF